ncbi:hypothetical protein ACPHXT_003930 [Vibrio alginolyticus]|nr:hypothetical protein [Vibrio parahaemolyticus]
MGGDNVFWGIFLIAAFFAAIKWAANADTGAFEQKLNDILASDNAKQRKAKRNQNSLETRRNKLNSSALDARGSYQHMQKAKANLHRKR